MASLYDVFQVALPSNPFKFPLKPRSYSNRFDLTQLFGWIEWSRISQFKQGFTVRDNLIKSESDRRFAVKRKTLPVHLGQFGINLPVAVKI